MALIDYPASHLPAPKILYSSKDDSSVIRTKIKSGAMFQRDLYGTSQTIVGLEFVFSSYELEIFKAWLKHKIFNGAVRFNLDLVLNEELESFDCLILEGSFSYDSVSHTHYSVAFDVFIENSKVISAEETQAIFDKNFDRAVIGHGSNVTVNRTELVFRGIDDSFSDKLGSSSLTITGGDYVSKVVDDSINKTKAAASLTIKDGSYNLVSIDITAPENKGSSSLDISSAEYVERAVDEDIQNTKTAASLTIVGGEYTTP